MNILLVNGHQRWEKFAEGTLNKSILTFLQGELKQHNLTISSVESSYDVKEELQKWVSADLIIFTFPVYWMSAPWGFKKYIEEVLMSSGGVLFANDGRSKTQPQENYGNGGLSQSKSFMIISSMNAPEEAFQKELFFEGSFDDLNKWLILNMRFIGIQKQLPSFVFYDVVKNPKISQDFESLKDLLRKQSL